MKSKKAMEFAWTQIALVILTVVTLIIIISMLFPNLYYGAMKLIREFFKKIFRSF